MSHNRVDLTGKVFERLTVKEFVGKNKSREALWLCECVCGNTVIVRGSKLRDGQNKSCGCLRKECHTTHSHSHRGKQTKTYRIWIAMKTRCTNPNVPCYKNYGGRGITICEEWKNDYLKFLEDMGECPENCSIERIDNNKGYSPENCKWATVEEQSTNKRTTRIITYNGKTQCLKDWSIELNISYSVLSRRINGLRWSIERAFTTPIQK